MGSAGGRVRRALAHIPDEEFLLTYGDGVSNVQEVVNGTSPILKDTDGDGVTDDKDAFPLDRFKTKPPPSNVNDNNPPFITLLEPPF